MSWHRKQQEKQKRGRPRKNVVDTDLEYRKHRKEIDKIAEDIEERWEDDFDEILNDLEEKDFD